MGRVAKLCLLVQPAVGREYETAGDQVRGRVILEELGTGIHDSVATTGNRAG